MNTRHFVLVLLVVMASCTDYHKYAITEADAGMEYYQSSYEELKIQIESKPLSMDLRKRKLFIANKLSWTEDLSLDIQLLIENSDLDYQSFGLALEFYSSTSKSEELLTLIDYWESVFGINDDYLIPRLIALRNLSRDADTSPYLTRLMKKEPISGEEALLAAQSYLDMSDSVNSMKAFDKLLAIDPSSPELLKTYVPLLLSIDAIGKSMAVLDAVSGQRVLSPQEKITYGEVLYRTGREHEAHSLIDNALDNKMLEQRSSWYERSEQFDSAMILLDPLIMADSNVSTLLKKAQLAHKGNRIYQAFRLLRIVQQKDSANAVAQEEIKIVGRKIAYLRKLKEQERQIPVLDLNLKKSTDNE